VGAVSVLALGCTAAESKDNPDGDAIPAAEQPAEAQPAQERIAEQPPRERPVASQPPASQPAPKQPAAEPPTMPTPTVFAPAGTRMTFRLTESLSTKSTRVGDRFQATLTEDVVSPRGEVLVPLGSVAQGVVVQSEESQGSDQPAVLALRMEMLAVRGDTHPLEATIVEADANADTRDSGGETAVKIAAGAAAGALLGRVIGGDTEGALVGAGAGAVAGTVFAVTTKGGHAEMGEGSTLTVRLDEPLPLP
jgi:hypothetical protein